MILDSFVCLQINLNFIHPKVSLFEERTTPITVTFTKNSSPILSGRKALYSPDGKMSGIVETFKEKFLMLTFCKENFKI